MIVGTAGHIDHGKTTLVRALTGVDTDRLKEEKARGISIELGYAYTPLSDGNILGFVDVPGHERLVHTMAAGACGIDFGLLVIAADDGVMPQTREHVAILQLFGVTRGAVALTKIDRVDEARLRAVESEIAAFLSTTAFRDAPLFRVNAHAAATTEDADPGTTELHAHLEREACTDATDRQDRDSALPPATPVPSATMQAQRRSDAVDLSARGGAAELDGTGAATVASGNRGARFFRLAIDRVFTLAGHGTIVAGTVFSGSVRTGDSVVLFPTNTAVRVRSIHSQNRPAEVGYAGERCALNITGVDKSTIKRGDWLADARALSPSSRIDVRIELLPDANMVLKAWTSVHFHHGAAHSAAHVVPLAASRHHAQIVFDTPICALPGDRFIIRDAGATRTIGGGVVLDPFAQPRKRRSAERIRYLHSLEAMIAGQGLTPLLAEAPHGVKESELVRLAGRSIDHLPPETITVDGSRERYILLKPTWAGLRERAVNDLRKFHLASPEDPGPDIGRLRRISSPQVPHDLWRALIADLARDGVVVRSDPWVHLPGHAVTLSSRESALAAKLRPLIAAGRFNPPWVRDLAGTLKAPEDDVRQVLRKQVTQGELYQVVHDLFYDRNCVDELAAMVNTLAKNHRTIEAAQYRDAVGLGRKRAIQILEFFDRVGHTRRVPEGRVLRLDSTWRPTQ